MIQDDQEVEAFISGYGIRLTTFLVQHRGIPEHIAEEAVSTAFVILHRHLQSGRRVEHPASFTGTIAFHEALRLCQKQGKEQPNSDYVQSMDHSVDSAFETFLLREELTQLVKRLPPRQREVIILRYLLDLSVKETARRLNCATGAVEDNTRLALKNLRGYMRKDSVREGEAQ
ncbi:RNA polymerase sigma factor [Nonomuraea aurantiaca]|uniref:RNA polymerase sigma factor n=1 Tax=Nonomuraea aurantiaca TaxID=2878562 RepID=UPI001CD98AB4|nr:sigma-70 family RNA polymerase sigma factor [Nonomuraea aurantiaca]MCA2220916.1 sigma-70 family RNA polymerase sigma factor [Nonomuraea aurantiaca]